MLSPRIALTARHCVSKTDGYSACDSEGNVLAGGKILSDHAANTMYVMLGVKPQFHGKADGQGKQLYVPESRIMCNSDIAVIELASPLANAKIAKIRLDSPPVKGETITAIGWGITESGREPSQRQQRGGVVVLDVGPTASKRSGIGAKEFQVGESICSGDSGGPAIAESTGAVIGVVSRGGNGTTSTEPAAACIGAGTYNTYTQVAPYKDLILQAFASTGEDPWLEGGPDPRKAKADTTCEVGDECRSGLCHEGVCVDPCAEGGVCAEGYTCNNDVGACLPNLPSDTSATDPGVKGCSTTGNAGSPTNALALVAAGVMVLARLRRRPRLQIG
jgi:MYXO-CTERM domain-containing protein